MTTRNFSHVKEVSWFVDDIEVGASLSIPSGEGPFPAVLFIAGSGPTDRNWNTPLLPGANGSGALLASALTDAGFVTLRYDKRASGPDRIENTQRMAEGIGLQSHVEEVAGGMNLLAGCSYVDPARIFALTNSEGCVHAINYQIQPTSLPFAGMILTSAFARTAGVLARSQIAAQLAAVPGGDAMLAAYDTAIADFLAGRSVQMDEKLPDGLQQMIQGMVQPVNQRFVRELWVYNPVARLAEVHVPVLVVLGKKDIQVDWQVDGALFEAFAQAHNQIRIVFMEHANHVLKFEPRSRTELVPAVVAEGYSSEDTTLDLDTVETISSWLKG
ncbi:MAG TPA: alpha/beta hydrolase [Levilinea sp.]|nr:alpha/beta hydrolase [Levilinea sp.]